VPLAHSVHELDPLDVAKDPAAQGKQEGVPSAGAYVPPGQEEQLDEPQPLLEVVPMGQAEQLVLPADEEMLPAGQLAQMEVMA